MSGNSYNHAAFVVGPTAAEAAVSSTGSHFMLTDCSEQATILIGSMKVACAWATKSGER